MISDDEFKQWFARNYPNGEIDWRDEHQRLLEVINQALPSIVSDVGSKAQVCAIEIACETGFRLQAFGQ